MTEQNTPDIEKRPNKRSRVKLAVVGFLSFLVLLLVLVAAGIYFLPRIVESGAKEFVAEKFNRELTIQKLDIDLLNLTAKLDGVVLTDPGSKDRLPRSIICLSNCRRKPFPNALPS